MKNNDWKERLGMVYSTNPDFQYETTQEPEVETLPKEKRRNRGGKVVTFATGFVGSDTDLKELGKWLKNKCGVGGSVKDGELIVQGDFKNRVVELLKEEGYTQTK